ncbi:TraS [Escherichia coli]|nr:TraS [Escherichia coli]EEW4879674.1 TraS [Escherichia coli]EEW9523085.1 TraS [Escherichia coli]EFA2723231.1 TraS [Escherichia coli]EFA6534268.1 TraS [Escherichia coli]
MSCELPPFTLLRTEHGNVIARDNRDNQEFVFAECYSTAIAALILAAVTLYTERKTYEQNTATHRPGPETLAFPAPATGHGIQR